MDLTSCDFTLLFQTVATNLVFDVSDGMFNCRTDLMDATACALARGAQVMGIGKYILYSLIALLLPWPSGTHFLLLKNIIQLKICYFQ